MVKVYRHHVTRAIVLLCAIVVVFAILSWGLTQAPTSYWNVETDTLRPNGVVSKGLRYEEDAERVEITIEYFTDTEFDVWLVDSAEWNMSYAFSGPGPWLRHAVAGEDVVEWTVRAREFEGELRLVEENKWYGDRGSKGNGTEVNYDWEITTRSIVNPMESTATWIMIGLLVLAVVMLAWEYYLPHQTFPEFRDLYPDFPESMETSDVEPDS
jgi:hypothetical protein